MAFSKRHYERLSNGAPDTPELVAERVKHRKACELAVADREAKFPTLTAENAQAAINYQDERIRFHEARL